MKLTKYSHACIRLEKDGTVLVLDPGNFSELPEALDGAAFLLITHEHPDHYDREPVHAFLAEHPEVQVWAPGAVVEELREAAADPARIHEAAPGESFEAGPFRIRGVGGQHALIHPLVPVVANVGYLIDGSLYHPGDSFVVPDDAEVRTLLVPIHAPWNKIQEVIDFVIAVGAEHAYPIHDALLAENGRSMIEGHVQNFGGRYGTAYRHLDPRESVEV
ncbi:MBL fold metallo-hydrolase [Rothia kristinae]|uniref:MBL fold metallo-hydrolase n=1 Tax=Rothia kristinae TaxID=37923 RepID=A0A1S2N174_9MICC|nr:MBL fold metallo-hydrolase [Rothia kristinae]OIJ36475.1 MBL fold metallo-hydrolase [Rothia kristinae]